MYRRKLRNLFSSWRQVSHNWFKERINEEEKLYRSALEKEMLVQWTSKVNALMLYMAQLEDKIKTEVQSRENLTTTYQSSLNKGVGQLNVETQALAENPLIKEISLLVAQQLIQKKEVDPNFQSMLTP